MKKFYCLPLFLLCVMTMTLSNQLAIAKSNYKNLQVDRQKESAINDDYTKLIIESPSLNFKCRKLLTDREEILAKKHKLQAINLENEHLLVVLPATKKRVRKNLVGLRKRIKLELGLYKLKITNKEEKIIKSGCPGLVL